MKRRIVVVAFLVIAIALAVTLIWTGSRKGTGGLVLSGNVEVTEARVGFTLPGKVVELLAEEGQAVKKDDPLASLDKGELASLVAQQKAYLREALTRLSELRKGSRPQEIEQAKALVTSSDADLVKLKRDFERAEILHTNGAISTAQYDAAKSAYENRAAQHKRALETLSLVREGPRREDIEAGEHRVSQARAALATAEERLKNTDLAAPFAGIILKKNVETGETVSQGTPVYTVGDLGNPWVKVYVKEDRLGLVKLGQPAKVTVDSYKGKVYEGRVTYISSEAEFTPKMVQTHEERVKLVFAVKVSVKNVDGELKPGMPADVMIEMKP
jgi:HlyD family secretion protein